jgi:hypothetical protein
MPDIQIGPAFLFVLGLLFAIYGLSQLIQAYRPTPLDEWMARALPGAGAVVLGVLLTWSSYRLGLGTAAATALHASGMTGAAFLVR